MVVPRTKKMVPKFFNQGEIKMTQNPENNVVNFEEKKTEKKAKEGYKIITKKVFNNFQRTFQNVHGDGRRPDNFLER